MKKEGDKPHYKDKDEQMEQVELKEVSLHKVKIPQVNILSKDGNPYKKPPTLGLNPPDERKLVSAARRFGLEVKKQKSKTNKEVAIYAVRDKDTKKLNKYVDAVNASVRGNYLVSYTGNVLAPGVPDDFRTGTRAKKGNDSYDYEDKWNWDWTGTVLRNEFLPAGEEELAEGSLTSTQIQNIKKLWNDPEKKTAKDVTQAVKDIVKKWDNDTRHAVSQAGIKHLSKLAAATESTNRYFDVKPGSIEDSINKMNKLEEMSVTINKKQVDDLVKQYISKGGVVTKLPPVLAPVAPGEKPPKEWDLVKGKSVPGSTQGQVAYKVKKVGSGYKILKAQLREFIRIYNEHFLTNYAAEEFIVEEK
jgi:hypothetical protein